MLDSQNDSDTNTASNAPGAAAFSATQTPQEEILAVTGASWAEYHLLLGESSHHCTRIESEIRTCGGAPNVAILLARWCAENSSTSHIIVQLSLMLGHDPNARLLRRELEKWQSKLTNMRVHIQEDAAAPEVAYRILMWPQASASTWNKPQVLQCGEIDFGYQVRRAERVFAVGGHEELGDDVRFAARAWGSFKGSRAEFQSTLGNSKEARLERIDAADELAEAALRCWNRKAATERIACELTWAEIEVEGRQSV
jgi:hypothetical protein